MDETESFCIGMYTALDRLDKQPSATRTIRVRVKNQTGMHMLRHFVPVLLLLFPSRDWVLLMLLLQNLETFKLRCHLPPFEIIPTSSWTRTWVTLSTSVQSQKADNPMKPIYFATEGFDRFPVLLAKNPFIFAPYFSLASFEIETDISFRSYLSCVKMFCYFRVLFNNCET